MKIVKKNQMKIVIFTAVKNRCMLHRRVFASEAEHKRMSVLVASMTFPNDEFHMSRVKSSKIYLRSV